MTYKIKSLIYFSCFVAACILYYAVEQENNFTDQIDSKSFVEAEFEDTNEPLEEPQNDFEVVQ